MKQIVLLAPPSYTEQIFKFAPADWHLVVTNDKASLINFLQNNGCDALILFAHSKELYDFSRKLRIPTVNISCALEYAGGTRVAPDNKALGAMAADHLIQRGHRFVGIISLESAWYAAERASSASNRCRSQACGWSQFSIQEGYRVNVHAAQDWLRTLPTNYALLAVNDLVAQAWHVAMPDSAQTTQMISIDNNEMLCSLLNPSLTSVHLPLSHLAKEICRQVNRLLSGSKTEVNCRIPPLSIITRESTDRWATDNELVASAIHWISSHATEDITVDDLITFTERSRRTVERSFNTAFGRGPRWFIEHYRIMAAQKLLLTTDNDLNRIALECGFSSRSRFHERFKKHTGLTPSNWRQQ